jgi:hypothetical protein
VKRKCIGAQSIAPDLNVCIRVDFVRSAPCYRQPQPLGSRRRTGWPPRTSGCARRSHTEVAVPCDGFVPNKASSVSQLTLIDFTLARPAAGRLSRIGDRGMSSAFSPVCLQILFNTAGEGSLWPDVASGADLTAGQAIRLLPSADWWCWQPWGSEIHDVPPEKQRTTL